MPGETQGPSGTQGLKVPAGTRARLAWQPPALRAAQSLLTETMGYAMFAVHKAGRLLEWHRRMARRVQPWTGSGQPPLEFAWMPELRKARLPGMAPPGREVPERGAVIPMRSPWQIPARLEAAQQSSTAPSGLPVRPAVPAGSPEATTGGLFGVNPPRVAPQTGAAAQDLTAAGDAMQSKSVPGFKLPLDSIQERLESLPPPSVALFWKPQPQQPFEEPPWQLRLSVSPQSRREVRGGFPVAQPLPPGAPEFSPMRPPEVVAPLGEAGRQPAWAPASTAGAVPRPEGQAAIEKLIERTIQPAPLPGLEIRIVRPGDREPGDQHRKNDDAENSKTGERAPAAPAAPPAPPLDINAVADKVYQTLLRRQRFERERKGIY